MVFKPKGIPTNPTGDSMIKIAQGNEKINSKGGNILIGTQISGIGLEKMDHLATSKTKRGEFSHSDIAKMAVTLLANGKSDFADIDLYRNDSLFKSILNLKNVASAASLRQRLNELGECNSNQTLLDEYIVNHLRKVHDYGKLKTSISSYIPLDIDVSVMLQPDCHKEKVSWTYHNAPGYAPIFCYLGTHGYMLGNELRPGSQHCSNGAIEFTQRCIAKAQKLGLQAEELLIRADSGHDDNDYFKALHEAGVKFLIKRNLRKESLEQYLALSKHCGHQMPSRDGKNIYRCMLSHRKPDGCEDIPMFMIVEVTERLTTPDGDALLIPEIEVSTWWTNLCEDEAVCIELYYDHGTSEQFHSEFKTDMGLESLPSGKFATNALILNLAVIAYNCLRFIGQEALKCVEIPVKLNVVRRRLRSVLQDMIYVGCKIISHANTICIKFGCDCLWFNCIKEVYARC